MRRDKSHDLGISNITFCFFICSIRRDREKALQESLPDDENLVVIYIAIKQHLFLSVMVTHNRSSTDPLTYSIYNFLYNLGSHVCVHKEGDVC